MILNLNFPVNTTSYGYTACNIIHELMLTDHDIRHVPIGINSPDYDIFPDIAKFLSKWKYDRNAPSIKLWHQHDLNSFPGHGIKIGMPIFELEEFNEREIHSLKNPDQLFACSNWAAKVIEDQVKEKKGHVRVVPLGVNRSIFKQCEMPNVDKTIFANFGKFEIRKGHDVLIEIFNSAFEKDDDVMLLLMPHNPFMSQEEHDDWIKKYKNSKLGDKIVFIGRQKSHEMVYKIMSQVHCGIFPSKAEGWNLEALELMSIGRHVIITNATGHTEFCNDSNSNLIQMNSGYEKALDNKFFNGSMHWRKFGENEIDQSIEFMRSIHEKRKSGSLHLNTEGIKTANKFTWRNTAMTLLSHIESII